MINVITLFRATFDAKVSVDILKAYFCTGNPFWPLNLNDHKNNTIFKVSVMITHYYLICREHGTIKNLTAYESRVTLAVKDVISGMKTANLVKTTICLKEKLLCVTFENFCGPN